ncbi:MAG: pyruvate, phosphate dikinase [Rickettsiales bacterium]|nr:pyruvate, phosphate dikinase [Rickettsiales bacterium]
MSKKWVYSFDAEKTDGNKNDKDLLGGKGANLAEMASLGLPVPPGFTLSTDVCTYFYDNGKNYPEEMQAQVDTALARLEKLTGKKFGATNNPLLLSVRSGARISMPGMMDTVLNLGLNDKTAEALASESGDARFAYDSYRRFIQMYSNVVLGLDHYDFEDVIETYKRDNDLDEDTEIMADGWQEIIESFKNLVKLENGENFPQDPKEQLTGAIRAVFDSWMNKRAITYRSLNNISDEWGTAVNVQAMVFGNMGQDCATGVAFTRNPSTGKNEFYGEFLINAQGEDVVAGIRTPQSLTTHAKNEQGSELPSMEEAMPEVFKQLCDIREKLEKHYADMQDIEFTVENQKLYMLQTRTGKRTAAAALKMAVDMVEEGLITKEQAVARIEPNSLDQLLHPSLDPRAEKIHLTRGLPASPGAASGQIVFTAEEAESEKAMGKKVILVRTETIPEDIHGMHAADGILTARGGMTSHAAVVARGMGRACVAGASEITIHLKDNMMSVGSLKLKKGDVITIDGGTGEVMNGAVPTIEPTLSGDFGTLMEWADDIRRMKIRTNAETAEDCKTALGFGAEGIGLCRTEHMFFDPARILHVREMIFAETKEQRLKALEKLEPEQTKDFTQIFDVMEGLPVTIRLLDPPLHEFLPHERAEQEALATSLGLPLKDVQKRLDQLTETNPMLGHRGCRLGVSYPEIYEMQVRAIFSAAKTIEQDKGTAPLVEVMIPLVSMVDELSYLKERLERIIKDTAPNINYLIGTMIELPRAALMADKIAPYAQFFSFGTNDLTQTTFGLSRDDAGSFLQSYQRRGLLKQDPFVSLDIDGVGALIETAYTKGRSIRPDIKTGICGEHGGDPASIDFCEKVGLAYVSCSPYRVPIARLAAAQATLNHREAKELSDEDANKTAALKVA